MIKKETKAYAKVNLTLDITGKSENGLHTLESIMQTVSLYDRVTVFYDDKKPFSIDLSVIPDVDFPKEENLCYKAAKAFCEDFGVAAGKINIVLEKNIPIKAGLGGGSSDCAAVLLLLAEIFVVEKKRLEKTAASLGSDVPFFLYGGNARVSGTGNIIVPTGDKTDLVFLLAKPEKGLSAAEVYREFDRLGGKITSFTEEKKFGNGLEEAVFSLCPECFSLCEKLRAAGSEKTLVSGSGTTVFGIFKTEEEAENAKKDIDKIFTAVCRAINKVI